MTARCALRYCSSISGAFFALGRGYGTCAWLLNFTGLHAQKPQLQHELQFLEVIWLGLSRFVGGGNVKRTSQAWWDHHLDAIFHQAGSNTRKPRRGTRHVVDPTVRSSATCRPTSRAACKRKGTERIPYRQPPKWVPYLQMTGQM